MGPIGVVITLWAAIVLVNSYPSGAPQSTCDDLTPRHGPLKPQTSQAPYTLTPAMLRLNEGNKLRLVLTSPNGEGMKGFMVQARAPGGTSGALGSFTEIPDIAKTLTCGAGIRNTLTHTNGELKKTVEIEWEPPVGYDGPVVFNSTFVKDGATFWVGIESDPVQVVRRSVPSGVVTKGISTTKIPIRITTEANYAPPQNPQTVAAQKHIIYNGCGDTKLCFGFPSDCTTSGTCKSVVSVKMSPSPPNVFTFELLGTENPGYVAVGLSNDAKMGDDQVVSCSSEKLALSINIGKHNQILPGLVEGITPGDIKNEDGNLYCKFTRKAETVVNGTTYDLQKTQYFLQVAQGNTQEDGSLRNHGENKAVTGESLNLAQIGEVAAKSNLLYRLHGAFMLAAWIGFAGTGMLVARYFKKTWVGTQACGKDIWFAWHRSFMVITWTLTMAGFVVIFVEIGGWYSETSNPHAVLGVVTTALCFIQPFAAYFRPAPSDKKRVWFNWSHWGIGNLAHLLAIITIFFARQLSKAELPEWNDYIVATYVAFHVFMHILFSITDCCSQRADSRVGNNFPMKEMGVASRMKAFSDNELDAPLTCLRRFLLTIYLLIVIALTIALVVIAAGAPIEKNEAYRTVLNFVMPNNTSP